MPNTCPPIRIRVPRTKTKKNTSGRPEGTHLGARGEHGVHGHEALGDADLCRGHGDLQEGVHAVERRLGHIAVPQLPRTRQVTKLSEARQGSMYGLADGRSAEIGAGEGAAAGLHVLLEDADVLLQEGRR